MREFHCLLRYKLRDREEYILKLIFEHTIENFISRMSFEKIMWRSDVQPKITSSLSQKPSFARNKVDQYKPLAIVCSFVAKYRRNIRRFRGYYATCLLDFGRH